MTDTLCTRIVVRCTHEERGALSALAQADERRASDVVRRLIRAEAQARGLWQSAADSRIAPGIANPTRAAQEAIRARATVVPDRVWSERIIEPVEE